MKRKTVVSLVLVIVFLVSVFATYTFSRAYSHGCSGVFGARSTIDQWHSMDVTNGLVGYWKFDEGSGITAYDGSGNGNNGTIYGATWVDGKCGKALKFDNISEYINIPDSNSLDIGTSDFTLIAWVYREDRSGFPYGAGAILSKSLLGSPPPGYFFGTLNNGSIYFELTRSPGGPSNFVKGVSNVPVPLNEWHHVAITFQRDGNATFYLDDNQVGITDISGRTGDISNDRPLLIGESETYPNQLNGTLDDVKIYNRSLSSEEIRRDYENTGPVGYWKFDEGSGTTAYDSSGYGNNGTVYGATWVDGKYGKALSFDGVVGKYVEVPDSASLDVTSQITVSGWFSLRSTIVSGGKGAGHSLAEKWNVYGVRIDNSGFYGYVSIGGDPTAGELNAPISPSTYTWYHVAYTFDGSQARVYVNGNLAASKGCTGNIDTSTLPLWIGANGGGGQFNGTIDEVKIYSRALSAAEVWAEYQEIMGVSFLQSANIAVVPDTSGGGSTSTLPTSGFSGGYSPNFTSIGYSGVNYANLLQYDTVIMYQANPDSFTASQKTDLAVWVSAGRKLIIWDSDAVPDTDYDWLPYNFTSHYPGQTGAFGGNLTILANNTLGSSDPASAYYINTTDITKTTDSVGDAKVFLTHDQHWFGHMWATNIFGKSGFTHAYAYYQSGIIIYCGLDADYLGAPGGLPNNQWLFKTYELELKLQCPPLIAPPGPVGITYSLVITTTAGGNTDPSPGNYSYWQGSIATVTAIPDINYFLDHWELDGSNVGTVNPYTVTMGANHTLMAVFAQIPQGGGGGKMPCMD
jgi:hypothetical protein